MRWSGACCFQVGCEMHSLKSESASQAIKDRWC
jgi:hypothetical protein